MTQHSSSSRGRAALVLASTLTALSLCQGIVTAQAFVDTFNNGSVPDADTRPAFWNQVIDGNGVISEVNGIPGVTLISQSGGPGNAYPFTQLASPLQNDFNFFRAPVKLNATGLGYATGDSPVALTQFTFTSQALDSAGPFTEYQAQDAFTIWVTNRTTANNGPTGYGTLLMGIKQDSVNRSTAFEGYPLIGPVGNVYGTQTFPGQIRSLQLVMGATFFDLVVTHDTSPTNPAPITATYRGGLDIYRVNSPYLANWATTTNPQGDSAFNIQTQLNNVPSTTPVANFRVGSVTLDRYYRTFVGNTFDNWSNSAVWSDPSIRHVNADNSSSSVPDFVGAAVKFPQTSSPTTVLADRDFTLGNLVIDSTQPYTLTTTGNGQGTLNLASRYPLAEVHVANGSGHLILTPVVFRSGSDALVSADAPGASMTLPYAAVEFASSQNLSKTGPGTIALGSVSSNVLTVSDGTLRVLPRDGTYEGMATGPSEVNSISFNGGLLDVTTTDLIVKSGSLSSLNAAVASWWNNGARNGTGLGSSSSTPTSYTTLAVLSNTTAFGFPAFSTFSGVAVAPTDLLVMYTYLGDTDLSGTIDARDISTVLNGWTNGLTGWHNGDTNYDGVVNGTDYANVLAAFANQGGPLGTGNTPASIPEPAVALAFLAPLPTLLRRRRGTLA